MQDVNSKSHSMHVVCLIMRDQAGCEVNFCLQSWQPEHDTAGRWQAEMCDHVAVLMCSMCLVADADMGAY